MPKDKPQWELYLIDNICPASGSDRPRFAIWIKIHHSLTDGVAGMRLVKNSLSNDPNSVQILPFWATPPKKRSSIGNCIHNAKNTKDFIKQLGSARPVIQELKKGLQARFNKNTLFVSTFDAPKSILNQPITGTRHLSVASFDKSRFTRIIKALSYDDCSFTTNDLLLAVCSGALRHYLKHQQALPDNPLIAFVPISLRRDNSSAGNQLSFLLANLATNKNNALERLSIIKQSMDNGKERFSRLSPTQVIAYSAITYGWAGVNLATRLAPTKQAFNLIISNVPSDNTPLYLHGARLVGMYPASVLFDGQAINITITNHQEQIDFGVTACSTALPDIEHFLSLVEDELRDFELLASTKFTQIVSKN